MSGMNDEGRRWYVVNTYSGHENKVKENLEKRVESMGLQDCLFNIVIPEHVKLGMLYVIHQGLLDLLVLLVEELNLSHYQKKKLIQF